MQQKIERLKKKRSSGFNFFFWFFIIFLFSLLVTVIVPISYFESNLENNPPTPEPTPEPTPGPVPTPKPTNRPTPRPGPKPTPSPKPSPMPIMPTPAPIMCPTCADFGILRSSESGIAIAGEYLVMQNNLSLNVVAYAGATWANCSDNCGLVPSNGGWHLYNSYFDGQSLESKAIWNTSELIFKQIKQCGCDVILTTEYLENFVFTESTYCFISDLTINGSIIFSGELLLYIKVNGTLTITNNTVFNSTYEEDEQFVVFVTNEMICNIKSSGDAINIFFFALNNILVQDYSVILFNMISLFGNITFTSSGYIGIYPVFCTAAPTPSPTPEPTPEPTPVPTPTPMPFFCANCSDFGILQATQSGIALGAEYLILYNNYSINVTCATAATWADCADHCGLMPENGYWDFYIAYHPGASVIGSAIRNQSIEIVQQIEACGCDEILSTEYLEDFNFTSGSYCFTSNLTINGLINFSNEQLIFIKINGTLVITNSATMNSSFSPNMQNVIIVADELIIFIAPGSVLVNMFFFTYII